MNASCCICNAESIRECSSGHVLTLVVYRISTSRCRNAQMYVALGCCVYSKALGDAVFIS